ncbi:MAG: reverse transcriptase domain-containing protein [Acidimicrobiaceae bacterium]|nr:reverse transcriptase domain-containing protein [Acidimicrobiaceae bacterium]
MGLENEIRREARRLILRHETKCRLVSEENARRARRSTASQDRLKPSRPWYWDLDQGFNPYLTRARTARIAHSIRSSLRDRAYEPRRPVRSVRPKADGGSREVCIYQVADSAVSKMLFEGILKKNLPLLSARAYAYRKDISPQNAIQFVRSELKGPTRLFIAEYDFSKFFDNIDHEHVRRILADRFLLTDVERAAIDGFLSIAPCDPEQYDPVRGDDRQKGIAQGTSISLLLANVAAWELDRGFEKVGVDFVRYADDTLIWSTDYGRICNAVELLHQQAEEMGVTINLSKSPGVRMLVPVSANSEMESTTSIEFLGYKLGLDSTTLKDSALEKIRKRIDQLIYWSLLHEPLHGTQNGIRFQGNVDRDYVSTIWRIRRYLYGDLSEKAVKRYQRREAPLRRFKGVMSAYPLIDDDEVLKGLDEWLLTSLFLAMRKRTRLLCDQGFGPSLPLPHNLPRDSLLGLSTTGTTTGERIDLSVPSVRRIAAVIRSATAQYGPSIVARIDPYEY